MISNVIIMITISDLLLLQGGSILFLLNSIGTSGGVKVGQPLRGWLATLLVAAISVIFLFIPPPRPRVFILHNITKNFI